MDKLHIMLIDAIKLLISIGYNHIEINDIVLNNRLSSTFGRYYHNKRLIEINTIHYKYSSKEDVMNTIIHELTHNIHDLKYGDNALQGDHNVQWLEIAKDVTEKTGYVIKEYATEDIDYSKIPKVEYFHHYLKCKICGHTDYSISKFKDASKVVKRKKCICCEVSHNRDGEFVCVGTKHAYYKWVV